MSDIRRFIVVFLTLLLTVNYSLAQGDFKVKGIHLDMRTQVMRPEAIKMLVHQAAQDGMNTLLLEYEATFPFEKHATICNKYAYTRSEIDDIIGFCTSLGVEVIPLQNCFGH